MPGELHFKPAYELAAMIRRGELKPSELMAATIRRIEQTNPKLNAFVTLRTDAAMAEARALDEKIARGEDVGPLAGLPLGVKDLEDAAGLATTHGSVPFKNLIAREDSVQVARLKAAGAIVIGKTNAPEFGYTALTKNLLFGVTRNPWNLERTPGGSSGGSSAAVAGGVVPLATGSDGGGSIRIPACYVGCFGLKPSFGRIPNNPSLGMQQWNDTAVVGALTRTVRDTAIFMDVAMGYHPVDPDSLPHPGISYAATLERLPRKLRIAFHPDFGRIVQHDVSREVEKAVGVFKDMGARGQHHYRCAARNRCGMGTAGRFAGARDAVGVHRSASRRVRAFIFERDGNSEASNLASLWRRLPVAPQIQRMDSRHLRAFRFAPHPDPAN
jgi:Asp-tRNA(Asn)/Glu-tRNA(Gln) amidotransferase A subunit family amidase